MKTIKVDIKDVKGAFPKSEWPCLEYCKELLNSTETEDFRLECWNYDRKVPEADWTVKSARSYVQTGELLKKRGTSGYRGRV